MRTHLISAAYCEREGIVQFIDAVREIALAKPEFGEWILTIVDDGSPDKTFEAAASQLNRNRITGFRLRILALSRNFGQQAAIQAGLEAAHSCASEGDFFVVLDSDLQHPPALVPQLLTHLANGADHVQMVRQDSERTSGFKRLTSDGFYALFRSLSGLDLRRGSSDFRAMSWRFLSAYLKLNERGRFNRGLFQWIGFGTVYVPYRCGDRVAGQTKYTLRRMLRLAVTGVLQFSSKPLILMCAVIVLVNGTACVLYVLHTAIRYLRGVQLVPGWPSIMFLVTFWSGALALIQLLLAVYIARVFDEVKGRPIYVVRELQEERQ
jgi:glycosyltransferase involved in cell wall biosynthesis